MAFEFEITEEIDVLSEGNGGWQKEFNLVSWNNREPKYDIRDWNKGHERCRKGITLTTDEVVALRDILNDLDLD